MRVFQSSYKDKSGRTKKTRMWYVEFQDHRETRRRIPGLRDRKQTEAIGRKVENLVRYKVAGEALDPVLTRWIETLTPRLRKSLSRVGLLDAAKVAALEPLAKHLEGETDADGVVAFVGFRQAMLAKGTTPKQVNLVIGRATRVFEGCGLRFWSDISASRIMTFLDGLRADTVYGDGDVKRGISAQTSNFYLRAVKGFCRWMVKDGRASESPVAHLDGLNVRTDRRHDRRALSVEEIRWLLDTTRDEPERFGMTGPERATLYRLAVETGMRANELRTVTRGCLSLDGDQPTVRVAAAYSKHRRQDELALRRDTARELKALLAGKLPNALAFNVPEKTAKMLREDLAAARAAWLKDAETAQERQQREGTSFLCYRDSAGQVADFHSLRHTAGSLLAASGVHPKVAQSVMRHSTIDLTMSRYTNVFAGYAMDALAGGPLGDRLPGMGMARAAG